MIRPPPDPPDPAAREAASDGAITLADVRAAAGRIRGQVVRTPAIERAEGGATLLCKAESLQPTGAFKLRGAVNLIATLPAGTAGVVTHSSGNHAQAVARAARLRGLRAVAVMPADAPAIKRERVRADGAEIVETGPDSVERERRARELAGSGLTLVPPFDHPLIVAGQGTAALELCEDAGPIDRLYAPVSGGGLLAGCATVVAALCPGAEVVGVEPEAGDDTRRSLRSGRRETVPPPRTIADGLRVRTPGAFTFPIVRRLVGRVETVSDDELLRAMAWAALHLRLVLEPSGAAGLACALREARALAGAAAARRFGVILSGGNCDPPLLARALALGR